jgi:transposase
MVVQVDEYGRVRRAHRDGMGLNELARTFHHSKRKIRAILSEAEPSGYPRRRAGPSILDPYKPLIDAILQADETAPRKQRHTARKIYRRLRDEHGYAGGPERVRLYVRSQQRRQAETFIPLDHDPGQRLEADFGHIYVDFPGGRQQVPVLVLTWAYSNCPFALALPTERTEAILHGMALGFTFFGCCPREVWWDNPTTVATLLFKGRQRQLHERYAALASHYCFEPLFCLVRRPQEKPHVEGRVKCLQRDWATPVPAVADLDALNAHLRACCLRDRERCQAGCTETIGQRFACDRDKALSLPARPFDPCLRQPAKVDKYQTVRFDHNHYSVPRAFAFTTVTVKGYVDQVAVVAGDQEIARHRRSYAQGAQVLEPRHYLAVLGRRPAALEHANVFRHWALPALFTELRQDLEQRHGALAGARQFIRVLQLLGQHPIARVAQAIERSRTPAGFSVEAIVRRSGRAEGPKGPAEVLSPVELPAPVRDVRVPPPNVRQFDQLLSAEVSDERPECAVTEGQPEAAAPADDPGRV